MFKKLIFIFTLIASTVLVYFNCFAIEEVNSIKNAISINEAKEFKEIEIKQRKYLFKQYDPTINCFGKEEIKNIPASYDQSPLLFDLALNKIVFQTNWTAQERFNECMKSDANPEEKWNLMKTYYTTKGEHITKDNFDKVILNYHEKQNIQTDYLGEVRKDNFAAIIARRTEKATNSNRARPLIFPICHYKKDGRWYHFSRKDYTDDGESKNFFDAISDECWYNNISKKESVFHGIFLASEAITREREPWWFEEEEVVDVTLEVWHEWETHLGDIKVKGKFISYEGKYVTIEKTDGEQVKLEFNRLCISDQNYVKKIMEKNDSKEK